MNIWITGARGFIGSYLTRELGDMYGVKVFPTSHAAFDLQNKMQALDFVNRNQINGIIHCAVVGGVCVMEDKLENVYTNLRMFETLNYCEPLVDFFISFGSGAEFDKSKDLYMVKEEEALLEMPSDPYGFAKNLINRRIQSFRMSEKKWYNLRLFGCFHSSENDHRFIKSCLLHYIRNEPMVIHENRYMDFFYMEDLLLVVKHYMKEAGSEGLPRSINLCYDTKKTLLDITKFINHLAPGKKVDVEVKSLKQGLSYCGDGSLLKRTCSYVTYTGLEEGIRKVYKELCQTSPQ